MPWKGIVNEKEESTMTKKVFKVILVLLMVVGLAVSVANMIDTDLHAQEPGRWVQLHKDIPDCYGPGNTCYDMTQPKSE